ncbi:hypothetical protein [Malikia spinosa]|uniref:hypothetical protein n=1 Tax=Malikia spinosa TaxID=86180 RepID=UPI0011B066D5|nr:hypothetical protein [Malikia spinosa]
MNISHSWKKIGAAILTSLSTRSSPGNTSKTPARRWKMPKPARMTKTVDPGGSFFHHINPGVFPYGSV